MGKLLEIWRRVRQDGGLLVMIALAVGICLLLPQGQEDTVGTSSQEEARLAAVLSAMEGVGKAEVVIRWDETSATMTQSGSRTPTGGSCGGARRGGHWRKDQAHSRCNDAAAATAGLGGSICHGTGA